MKTSGNIAILAVAVISLAVSLFTLFSGSGDRDGPVEGGGVSGDDASKELARMVESLDSLKAEVAAIKMASDVSGEGPRGEEGGFEAGESTAVDERLSLIETSLAKLRSDVDGISVEGSAEERAALFLAEDGFEKADAYFEAGKYTIAADGYMQFVQAHPDHPDARNILERARKAYEKAGYSDMAVWVQEEMMKSFPETREADLMTLAGMEKLAGRYDEAIRHSAEAAELATNPEAAMWNRLYWAWYNQLRDGTEAGLEAYREVQAEIQRAGLGDARVAERAQEKIDELQRQIAGRR